MSYSPNDCSFLGCQGYSLSSKFDAWKNCLVQDKDKIFLLQGIQHGFRLSNVSTADIEDVESRNHTSALKFRDLVEKELVKQLGFGHYVFSVCKPKIVSPLGAILKEDGCSVRLIHDGSIPYGMAMNDYSGVASVKYESLDAACALAKPGWYMAKVDLRAAYRSVPIHPEDYCTTGINWHFTGDSGPRYLFDTRLPFGSRLGPCIFSRITQAVKRIMYRKGFTNIVVYLDDFLLLAESYEECCRAQAALISLLTELGFLVSWDKVVSPSTCLVFLGVTIDTCAGTLSLDSGKLGKVLCKLQLFHTRKRATKRQLQSLAGLLNWACQAVKGGRFFLRRIIDSINKLKGAKHKIQLSKDFKLDIEWWMDFLELFNGVVYFNQPVSHVVHADASNVGAGLFYCGDWYYHQWDEYEELPLDSHINNKEIMAVILAARRWGHLWSNSKVLVCTDNTVTKAVINKGTCKNKYVMQALRGLFWLSVRFNFKLQAVHIPGVFNQLPDAISRLHSPGQCRRLCSLLCTWHHGVMWDVDWQNHMSEKSFQMLAPQLHVEGSKKTWQMRS